jgi:hypothetical protein
VQVEIEFIVDNATGATSMRIKGIKGKGCRPIHKAVSEDLQRLHGITELAAEDTPEARETAIGTHVAPKAHLR